MNANIALVRASGKRLLTVRESPAWETLPDIVKIDTSLCLMLCQQADAELIPALSLHSEFEEQFEILRERRDSGTIMRLATNCAAYGRSFLEAGYAGTLEIVNQVLENCDEILETESGKAAVMCKYHIASLAKIAGQKDQAIRKFIEARTVAEAKNERLLSAKCSFHIAEIYQTQNENSQAEKEYSRCLVDYPEHKKARENLEQIKGRK